MHAQESGDLPYLTGGHSPFDDFGPQAAPTAPRSSDLHESGGLVDDGSIDGSIAGSVSWRWNQWGPTAGSLCAMIWIWLRPDWRGRGIGRLAELFFAHTPVNRVEAHTDIENTAEQWALEAAGFTREGVVRGARWRDGDYRDAVLDARLREDAVAGRHWAR